VLNTVIEGDCLEIMKLIAPNSIDLILTDLPYQKTQNSWDTIISLIPLWEQVKRVLKPSGAFITTAVRPLALAMGI
jgi:site-specific DNA-methyltransferase (adenine-specific)